MMHSLESTSLLMLVLILFLGGFFSLKVNQASQIEKLFCHNLLQKDMETFAKMLQLGSYCLNQDRCSILGQGILINFGFFFSVCTVHEQNQIHQMCMGFLEGIKIETCPCHSFFQYILCHQTNKQKLSVIRKRKFTRRFACFQVC